MKTLYITRHAKAENKSGEGSDFDRPLKEEGKKDALRMAQRLQKMEVLPDELFSSPALRAKNTARILMEEWGYASGHPNELALLYPGVAEEIIQWLPEIPSGTDRTMIVGHQPDLSRLVELLTGDGVMQMPPCSVVCCEFGTDDWNAVVRGSGHLKWSLSPERI